MSTWIVLGVIAAAILYIVMVYNGLVALRQRVSQAFADIDVQLKQRHDLIPNLIETVKGYASHEKGTLDAVIKARNAAISAQGPAAQANAENVLTGALRGSDRAVGGLSGPQGQHQFPAIADRDCPTSKTRSPPRAASSTTRCRNTIPASSNSRPRCSRARSASRKREFFDLGETRGQLEQAPQVKF